MGRWKIISLVGAGALALAACQSTVSGQAAGGPTSPASSAAAPSEKPSAAASSAAVAAGDGGEVTKSGTKLSVGQPATVNYETESGSKETTKLTVTNVSVKKGAISDMKNFNLDAQTKTSEPYYVTMSFKNAGPKPMKPGGIFGLIEVHNAAGDELGKLNLIGTFKLCEGDVPETLAVGESYNDCNVYLAPPGQSAVDVEFSFYVDLKKTEITWKQG
ncbi:hypothetical protein [Actinocrispum sp. NPDC049592]|uniref:hypothetical protein n=1 Tax=Actinocrispum sp. NPDC049592 TaxID=3154835 RepID=UPI003414BFA7